jgi:hypothetical protein
MTRGPNSFKETDLMRALKTAAKAGLEVVGYEINPKETSWFMSARPMSNQAMLGTRRCRESRQALSVSVQGR